MHLVNIRDRPYAVINGKDYAVYRWYDAGRQGPIFLQVAGRTALSKDDLPTNDWLVKTGRDGSHRISTAWRHPWFDYRVDAARKLAFLGGSSAGSIFLAFQYLAKRFGVLADLKALFTKAATLAEHFDPSHPRLIERVTDRGLSSSVLVTLDLPSYFDGEAVGELLGLSSRP